MAPFPLVLLHHSGGTARVFDALVKALPPEIDPVLLELPGHGRRWRDPLLTTVDDAVDDLARAVAGLPGPFAVFGHSVGAYLGLALVARLEADGDARCTTLFASANAAPVGVKPPEKSPLLLTDEEMFELAGRTGGVIPPQVRAHRLLRKRAADLLRADFALSASCVDELRATVVRAGIVVCCGSSDVFTDAELTQWSASSAAPAEVLRFPGGHFYLEEDAVAPAAAVAHRMLGSNG